MVPEAIAGLVSYEAERRLREETGMPPPEPEAKIGQLLRLTSDEKARSASLRTLLLLYPSDVLSRLVDPLSLWRAKGVLSVKDMEAAAEEALQQALLGREIPRAGRDLWHLVVALDRSFAQHHDARVRAIGDGLAHKGGDAGEADSEVADEVGAPQKEGHAAIYLLAEATKGAGMNPQPVTEDEIKDLARLALGSPAICMLRSFRRYLATSGAASGASANGLRPHWIYEGSAVQPAHIEAVIPLPPLSREERRAEILSRQAALYRLAFGQPRQTDLIALLAKTDLQPEEREKLFIQLTPPKGGRDEATN